MDSYEQDRRAKLAQLIALGMHPYTSDLVPDTTLGDLIWDFTNGFYKDNKPTQENGPVQVIAGRIVLYRAMGNLIFCTIRDHTGNFQVAFSKKRMSAEQFGAAKKLDLADLIAVKGRVAPSQSGELTMWADEFRVSSKSLVPPPAKHDGLTDVEARYRQRYVDLWANPEVLNTFTLRSNIVHFIRHFMRLENYIEVETPMMHAIAGGAAAQPFVTHHKALGIPLYMRIAPELFLKRCLVGGMPRVFEIGRNFRNEGISPRHNPEFTALEAYCAYGTWETMADLAEYMVTRVAHGVIPGGQIQNGKQEIASHDGWLIDLTAPWRRVPMVDLVKEQTGWDFDGDHTKLLELYENEVEKTLRNPTFVLYPPANAVPLAKECPSRRGFADSFELVINGMEIGCGYTEQNDPDKQLEHFKQQFHAALHANERTEHPAEIDHDFINALKVGMPPAGGLGIGVDRLVMVLTSQSSARDVILFPTLRPA